MPDVHYGRRNADFGQGFYLSDDLGFAQRWANETKDAETYINVYDLDLTGLDVVLFGRDETWFDYIFQNRMGAADRHGDADVVIGPIANDTLYDTYGLITSGLLKPAEALQLLRLGNEYFQIALKSDKAAARLHWQEARTLDAAQVERYRREVREEEKAFQEAFGATLQTFPAFAEIDEIL